MTNGFPSYLKDRQELIRQLGQQTLPPFSKAYRGWEHPHMRQLYQRFPDSSIQRGELISLFTEWSEPVFALVATLVWGMIDTKKQGRLQQVLAVPKDQLLERLNRIRELVFQGRLEHAFQSCCEGGANRIPGIGPSYFTKIFFFIGQATAELASKPLILDKWTTNAFFALHGQVVGADELRKCFTFPSLESLMKYKSVPLKLDVSVQAAAYERYVSLMNSWAGDLRVLPDKLEQFVFGFDLRSNKKATNPRIELLSIIQTLIV